jgi:hypothetical protein
MHKGRIMKMKVSSGVACLGLIALAGSVTAGTNTTFTPPAYQSLFSAEEAKAPHVRVRSFNFPEYPFLDGQWEGIIGDRAGKIWFGISTHSGKDHTQLFCYDPKMDRVKHVADIGQVCGETSTGNPPQDKIHSSMFEDGDWIYCGTCDGHNLPGTPYKGGYWLGINRITGTVSNLAKSVTEDGLLCVGYDENNKLLYGHTNHKGLLTCFDPATRKETVLGFPWKDSGAEWPRGLTLMIAKDGRVYGARPPDCSIWEYNPKTGDIRTLDVKSTPPADVAAGDEKAIAKYRQSAAHLTLWNEQDQCFYLVRSYDEMLCRFYPPAGEKPPRLETVAPLGFTGGHRFGSRYASCTLVIQGRMVYYTPYTGWGGTANLISLNLDSGVRTDYGPLVVEGDRRVGEVHSMTAGNDGRLYMVGFVYSIEGLDSVREHAMRDKYPFHPRLMVVDIKKLKGV